MKKTAFEVNLEAEEVARREYLQGIEKRLADLEYVVGHLRNGDESDPPRDKHGNALKVGDNVEHVESGCTGVIRKFCNVLVDQDIADWTGSMRPSATVEILGLEGRFAGWALESVELLPAPVEFYADEPIGVDRNGTPYGVGDIIDFAGDKFKVVELHRGTKGLLPIGIDADPNAVRWRTMLLTDSNIVLWKRREG